MYKLNKNSKSSRFYSWIYNTDVTKYKTMCPYFWRYGFTILLLPLILLIKLILYPFPSLSKIPKIFNNFKKTNTYNRIDEIMGVILVITLSFIFLFIVGFLFYILITNINEFLKLLIFIILSCSIMYFVIFICKYIVFLYKKLCPVIYWEKE